MSRPRLDLNIFSSDPINRMQDRPWHLILKIQTCALVARTSRRPRKHPHPSTSPLCLPKKGWFQDRACCVSPRWAVFSLSIYLSLSPSQCIYLSIYQYLCCSLSWFLNASTGPHMYLFAYDRWWFHRQSWPQRRETQASLPSTTCSSSRWPYYSVLAWSKFDAFCCVNVVAQPWTCPHFDCHDASSTHIMGWNMHDGLNSLLSFMHACTHVLLDLQRGCPHCGHVLCPGACWF